MVWISALAIWLYLWGSVFVYMDYSEQERSSRLIGTMLWPILLPLIVGLHFTGFTAWVERKEAEAHEAGRKLLLEAEAEVESIKREGSK